MMLWLSHDIKWLVHYDKGQKHHCNKTQVIRISRTNKRQDRNMLKRYIVQIIIVLSALIALPSYASEEGQDKLAYFTLEPDLTTNFYTKGKQLGYIQVRIDIMVAREADLPLIEQHQPLIRDAIVEMLGKQSEDTIKSLAGREDLRKNLVDYLNSILLPETGRTIIADLLFTKYLYQ